MVINTQFNPSPPSAGFGVKGQIGGMMILEINLAQDMLWHHESADAWDADATEDQFAQELEDTLLTEDDIDEVKITWGTPLGFNISCFDENEDHIETPEVIKWVVRDAINSIDVEYIEIWDE